MPDATDSRIDESNLAPVNSLGKSRVLGLAALMMPLLSLLGACSSSHAGELIVAIDTDMSLPKDMDGLRLEVYQGGPGGTLLFGDTYTVPQDERLPATLAIVAGSNNTVDIRLLGILGSHVKVLREAVTTVPTDRQATLRMPAEWLCYGEVDVSTGIPESTCAAGQTCVAGTCQDAKIDSTKLPAYKAEDVFGGASGPGSSGTCFDTVGCFGSGFVAHVDLTTCTMPTPTGGVGINVGLVTSAGDGVGICGTDSCYIPLDYSPDGWSVQGSTVQLPAAVCTRIASGDILSVVATTSCETKTPSNPTCGAWSSVTSTQGTFDAEAPDGALAPAPTVDAAPPAVDAPSQALSCPNVWTIDTSACNPVTQTGCPTGMACAVVSPTAVGCVGSNLKAADAGAGKEGYPCSVYGCADGFMCNQAAVCGGFCCQNSDCLAYGDGLQCTPQAAAASVDGGVSEGGAAGGTFGVCQ
jgi:hypothetical protein